MEWVDSLRGQLVGLDTSPFIFFIEEHPDYLPIVLPLFQAIYSGQVQAVTSTITLVEVLVHPLRQGNTKVSQQYRTILTQAQGINMLAITPDIAETAARLRADFNLRTPDAIQVAAALKAGATTFITNDRGLVRLPDMRMVLLAVFA